MAQNVLVADGFKAPPPGFRTADDAVATCTEATFEVAAGDAVGAAFDLIIRDVDMSYSRGAFAASEATSLDVPPLSSSQPSNYFEI